MTEQRQYDLNKPEDALAFVDAYVARAMPPPGEGGGIVRLVDMAIRTLAQALADNKAEHEAIERIKAEQAALAHPVAETTPKD